MDERRASGGRPSMAITAEDIEVAFAETVGEQMPGEPLDWQRVADRLNERLADRRDHVPLTREITA